jgi:hypothetical protein
VRRELARLAGVGDLGGEEVLEPPLDAGRHLVEELGALGDGELAPGAPERPAGRGHRGVDLGGAGLGDGGDQRAVDRARVVEAPGGGDVLAVDEVEVPAGHAGWRQHEPLVLEYQRKYRYFEGAA